MTNTTTTMSEKNIRQVSAKQKIVKTIVFLLIFMSNFFYVSVNGQYFQNAIITVVIVAILVLEF